MMVWRAAWSRSLEGSWVRARVTSCGDLAVLKVSMVWIEQVDMGIGGR